MDPLSAQNQGMMRLANIRERRKLDRPLGSRIFGDSIVTIKVGETSNGSD